MFLFLLLAFLTLLADLAANAVVDAWLTERIPLLGSFIGLQLTHNPGVAFGVRFPPVLQAVLIGAALLVVLVLGLRSAETRVSHAAFGLIAGGAIANIVDRLVDGLVTDYIQVGAFPIFNAADSCITVGALLLIAEAMGMFRKR